MSQFLKLSRRAVLRGAGGVALGLPFLEAMTPRSAAAQMAQRPKRLVILYSGNGRVLNTWTPAEFGPNFTVSRTLKSFDTPLLRPHLTVLSGIQSGAAVAGLKITRNGHKSGMNALLTGTASTPDGWASGPSIDQHIARSLMSQRPAGALPSLELGVETKENKNGWAYTIYSGAGSANAVASIDDPLNGYVRALSGVVASAPMPDQAKARADLERAIRRRKSVLDFVGEELKSISGRLGAADQARLDQHATLLREFEGRLSAGGTVCSAPDKPGAISGFPDVSKAQMDNIVAAFRCDMTRVASLQWAGAQCSTKFTWAGVSGSHHQISHATSGTAGQPPAAGAVGGANEQITLINTWLASQVAYLATELSKIDDGGGQTALDNSAILWVTEVAEGSTHSNSNLPWLLVGGLGGALKKGEHIDVKGQNQNNLFVSLGQAMGLPNFTTFGDPRFCTGPMTQLMA